MRTISALRAVLFSSCCTACGPEMDPQAWQSCHDVGLALSQRVDRCFSDVQPYFPTFLAKEGDFFNLWDQLEVCKALGEDQEARTMVDAETLEQIRECGGWLVHQSCDDLGEGIQQFTDGVKEFGQPDACKSLAAALEAWFSQ